MHLVLRFVPPFPLLLRRFQFLCAFPILIPHMLIGGLQIATADPSRWVPPRQIVLPTGQFLLDRAHPFNLSPRMHPLPPTAIRGPAVEHDTGLGARQKEILLSLSGLEQLFATWDGFLLNITVGPAIYDCRALCSTSGSSCVGSVPNEIHGCVSRTYQNLLNKPLVGKLKHSETTTTRGEEEESNMIRAWARVVPGVAPAREDARALLQARKRERNPPPVSSLGATLCYLGWVCFSPPDKFNLTRDSGPLSWDYILRTLLVLVLLWDYPTADVLSALKNSDETQRRG